MHHMSRRSGQRRADPGVRPPLPRRVPRGDGRGGRQAEHSPKPTAKKMLFSVESMGPTVADLAAYMVSRGGNAAQVDGWSVGKNPRGDTIFTDPASGRVFRSKPEVARFLNVGEPLDEAGDEPASDSDSMKNFIDDVLDSD